MLLENKVAVVYGAGGELGGAVARTFAAKGAAVHLTGRRREPLDILAKEIRDQGGQAEVAEVDALDEHAVDGHLSDVVGRAGRIDISFNAVGLANDEIVGRTLLDLDAARFTEPVAAYATTYFLTARHAARRMVSAGSGVIMTVSAILARRGSQLNGGYGAGQAAKEALTRDLSAELAPRGIRVVGLRVNGIPDTASLRAIYDIKADAVKMPWEQFSQYVNGITHTRRSLKIDEFAEAAAFLASDKAGGLTGTTLNLTMGALDD